MRDPDYRAWEAEQHEARARNDAGAANKAASRQADRAADEHDRAEHYARALREVTCALGHEYREGDDDIPTDLPGWATRLAWEAAGTIARLRERLADRDADTVSGG